LIGFLVLLVFPALACNLPARGAEELVFPTPQPDLSNPGLPFPTNEAPQSTSASYHPTQLAGTSHPNQPTLLPTDVPAATPIPILPTPLPTTRPGADPTLFSYLTQSGDTLPALASRFGVSPEQISPPQPSGSLLTPGQVLTIPNGLSELPYPEPALPDSAVVYSPEAAGFSIEDYILQAGGFLSTHQEYLNNKEWLTGAEIVRRVAENTSVNPKVLLAFLEFRSGWVRGQPFTPEQVTYPIGFYVPEYKGLYLELSLVAKQLNLGYYGWRDGSLTTLDFPDGSLTGALQPRSKCRFCGCANAHLPVLPFTTELGGGSLRTAWFPETLFHHVRRPLAVGGRC
jgi:LysM repeat protein